MIELTRKDFSKAVGAVLLANIPAIAGDEMNGADSVDAICDLAERANRGDELPGMPPSNRDPRNDREAALFAISDAIRDLASAWSFMKKSGKFRESVVSDTGLTIERLQTLRLVAEALSTGGPFR